MQKGRCRIQLVEVFAVDPAFTFAGVALDLVIIVIDEEAAPVAHRADFFHSNHHLGRLVGLRVKIDRISTIRSVN